MLPLVLSPHITAKLGTKHQVTEAEVKQCFYNVDGEYIEETALKHKTNPPSFWFLARTNQERLLKIIFTPRDGNIFIKSAYDANQTSIDLYMKLSPHSNIGEGNG